MKMGKILITFWAILLFAFLAGCDLNENNEKIKGNGNVISLERQADEFDSIVLVGVGNVNVYPAENFRVVVVTDANIQDYVIVETRNNNLTLTLKSGYSYEATQITFNIYLPELSSVNTEGVGNITISAGNAENLGVYITGVGNVDSQNYEVQNITIDHSGFGNATIWATNSINGKHSGIGNILYKGNPTINVNKTGLGNIKPL